MATAARRLLVDPGTKLATITRAKKSKQGNLWRSGKSRRPKPKSPTAPRSRIHRQSRRLPGKLYVASKVVGRSQKDAAWNLNKLPQVILQAIMKSAIDYRAF